MCFNNDTPRVNGSELFISFDSTADVDFALCEIEDGNGNPIVDGNGNQIDPQDCKSNFMIMSGIVSRNHVYILLSLVS